MTVTPREYQHALRNPLMGFRGGIGDGHEYSLLSKSYIRWRDIEDKESDGIDKIRRALLLPTARRQRAATAG